jgi:lysophospholipase L1-like esterase
MKIVIIGDSHSDTFTFGSNLKELLEAKGATVDVMGVGSSAAYYWLQPKTCRIGTNWCRKLSDAVGKGYDLAIIALGTNDAANANKAAGKNAARREPLLRQAIKDIEKVGGKIAPRMIWVGPPKMAASNDTKSGIFQWYTNDAMNALYAVGLPYFGDRAIDSRPLMPEKLGGDGVHMGKEAYKVWAQGVADKIDVSGGSEGTVTTVPAGEQESSSGPSAPATKLPAVILVGVAAVLVLAYAIRKKFMVAQPAMAGRPRRRRVR